MEKEKNQETTKLYQEDKTLKKMSFAKLFMHTIKI